MCRGITVLVLLLVINLSALTQVKTIEAVKAIDAPKIDGKLNDEAWKNVQPISDLQQFFPNPGTSPTSKTEIKILYDNDAVYVSAYLFDDPSQIRTQLTSRDGEQQSDVDYFSIFFDTYNDQQNGFQFLVTSANVQSDAKLSGGANARWGNYGDKSWDAVWDSKTEITTDGWTVEMRIPYISLRFSDKEVQTWGIQFLRFIRRNSETIFWNPVDPKQDGFVNQFGKYNNLKDIQPPLRLSFSPYLSTGVRSTPINGTKNTEWLRNGGMDVKYGINESFTLDMTLIPDFGQVVSDNVINNLSPFEIQFQENRPFFTEGTELFNKAGLFYSRRVGSTPIDYDVVHSFVDANNNYKLKRNPSITQLYNAVKFSGRTDKKLGIGVFNAVTAPMYARVENSITGKDSSINTEPLTNYNIIVLDQAFKGRSHVTFTNTNVMRNGQHRDANVSALDFGLFDKTTTYVVGGTARYSKTWGLTPYHFLSGTPYSFISDIDTVSIKGKRYVKPYDGFSGTLQLGKISGKVQYNVSSTLESSAYDANDLGYVQAPNEVTHTAYIGYNQFEPTNNFFNSSYSLQFTHNSLFKPYRFSFTEITARAFWLFKNMWDINVQVGGRPTWQNDYFELRTRNRFVKRPKYGFVFVEGSTDSRKKLFVSYELGYINGDLPDNPYYSTELGLRYRFSNKFTLSVNGNWVQENRQIGYAGRNWNTNGEPYIGFRDFTEFSTVLSGNYNFTSRINFTFRARHYWSKVQYESFYNVKPDGYYEERPFIGGQDGNFNIFNLDAFFTWDFKPGSRVVAGWKNWLGDDYIFALNTNEHKYYGSNLRKTFDLPHGNELTLRVIYFIDYNQLRKKK